MSLLIYLWADNLTSMNIDYSLMIQGGAGTLDNIKSGREAVRYLKSIRVILEHGRNILKLGDSAKETVETCTAFLEDDPLFNAGCGSVLNENGKVDMDAAIMDGEDLSVDAVAGISNTISDLVEMKGLDARQSADQGIDYLVRKVNGRGGVIVIGHNGLCASQFTTKRMIHGWIEKGGKTFCQF